MKTKGLWIKDYKQSKFLIWAFWLVSLYVPLKLYTEIKDVERMFDFWGKSPSLEPFQYHYYWNYAEISLIQVIIILTLASTLIGLERTNQSMDFTLSLPFKRQTIVMSKWLLGVVHIVTATVGSTAISLLLLKGSLLEQYTDSSVLWYFGLVSLLVLIGIYSFSLVIGFMGASVVSQFMFSIIFLLFPMGMVILIDQFLRFHYKVFSSSHFYYTNNMYHYFENISIPIQLLLIEQRINGYLREYGSLDFLPLIIPIIITIVSLILLLTLSKNMKSENNGKIVVYEGFLPVLKIGVFVCFYLLGGAILPSITTRYDEIPHWSSYHIGGFILGGIAYFILSKLLGTRLQLGKR